jgi:hypothetical protein
MKNLWLKFKRSDFYRTYKEEMIVVPAILIIFFLFNSFLVYMFPNSAFFDYYSEIETLLSKIVVFLVAVWTARLALRVSFPKMYKFMHQEIYHKFDSLPMDKKMQYSIIYLVTFIIAAALIFSKM